MSASRERHHDGGECDEAFRSGDLATLIQRNASVAGSKAYRMWLALTSFSCAARDCQCERTLVRFLNWLHHNEEGGTGTTSLSSTLLQEGASLRLPLVCEWVMRVDSEQLTALQCNSVRTPFLLCFSSGTEDSQRRVAEVLYNEHRKRGEMVRQLAHAVIERTHCARV